MDVIINGKKYSSGNVSTIILGRLIVGIKAISYKYTEDLEDTLANGNEPYGYTQGNYKAEASITLYMDEVEGIRRRMPKGTGLSNIAPFTVTVAYLNEDNIPANHSFVAKFKGDGQDVDFTNSGALSTEIPMKVIGKIKWN